MSLSVYLKNLENKTWRKKKREIEIKKLTWALSLCQSTLDVPSLLVAAMLNIVNKPDIETTWGGENQKEQS